MGITKTQITEAYRDRLRSAPVRLVKSIMREHPDRSVRCLAYGILINRGAFNRSRNR